VARTVVVVLVALAGLLAIAAGLVRARLGGS
jgi:hypothetical protein